uniref:Fungal lipase-like domain-containing protein n=1 Tax=Acrobeloides nanus TaxID=290746 RepID=A0A914DWM3_9BILA
MFNKDNSITCAGSVFVIHDEQAILLMFRWTVGNTEGIEEFDFYNMTLTFPGGGTVSEFYYNSFQVVWNNGMRDTFLAAKNSFPTYELWVTGVSMGASMAALAAPYISQMGYFAPKDIKMVNYGELRVGHKDFADRYPSLVPYAYRIVHRNDIMPHIIPLEAGYVHHQNEIWYNNLMHETDPWVECDAEESQNCSDSVPKSEWTKLDHVYFEHTCNC